MESLGDNQIHVALDGWMKIEEDWLEVRRSSERICLPGVCCMVVHAACMPRACCVMTCCALRVCIAPCGLAQVRNVAGEFMQVVEAASGRQPSSGKASSGQGVVRLVAKIVRALRWMGAPLLRAG